MVWRNRQRLVANCFSVSMHLLEGGSVGKGTVSAGHGSEWQMRQVYSTDLGTSSFLCLYQCCSFRFFSAATGSRRVSAGQTRRSNKYENLWRSLIEHPSNWWDHRAEKADPRFPDFKNKKSGEGLWLKNDLNPRWVSSAVKSMRPGVLETHVFAWHQRLSKYNKAKQYEDTLELYEQIQEEGIRGDPYIFVHALHACTALQALEQGRLIHRQVKETCCESNTYVNSCLVDMYAKCGCIGDAWKVFVKIRTHDVVSWTSMIAGFAKCGQGLKAINLFQKMQRRGIEPDSFTFVGVLNACASIAALEEGKRVHGQIVRSGYESDLCVGNSLVDMYAKCGSLDDARRVFNNMPKHDVGGWNAMIMGYSMSGRPKDAIGLFEKMVQTRSETNEVTFMCLLSACSHGGMVKEGVRYFQSMRSSYGVRPTVEHYTWMVDILGRGGQLDDAEKLLKSMPLEPCATPWISLVNACRVHGDLALGERAAKEVLKVDPTKTTGYVFLSNIHAAASLWDSTDLVHERRLRKNLMKQPSRSWIEIDKKMHSFTMNDIRHPQISEIHEELRRLYDQIKEVGCVSDTKFSLHDVEEEAGIDHLPHHSEKLAIAFGLISTPAGTPLRIVKTLRVCGNCHTAAKYFSKIVGRLITVRDGNRFHHFKDGLCTCGDYW